MNTSFSLFSPRLRAPLAVAVSLFAVASVTFAGQTLGPKLKPEGLAPVFKLIAFTYQEPQAEREKILGKPIESHEDRAFGAWKRYKYPGTEGITHYEALGYWYINLPKGTTWQEAIRALGLKAENFTPKLRAPHGKYELIGKWEGTGQLAVYPESILRNLGKTITFAGDGAKRDDGKLVNPSGNGLPVIGFDFSKYDDK